MKPKTKSVIQSAFGYSVSLAAAAVSLPASHAIAADAPAARTAPTTQKVPGPVEQLPTISVFTGRSTLVQTPFPIKRVSVTDPKVADIQMLTPNQLLVAGKSVGATDLIMWGETEQAREAPVVVSVDRASVRAELLKIVPKSDIDVRVSNDVLIITGKLSRVEEVEALHKFLEAAQLKYVDMTTLAGLPQVQIKVMVAEASRTAIRALGINAIKGGGGFFGGSTIGPDGGGPLNPMSIGAASSAGINPIPFSLNSGLTVGPASTLFAGFPHANLEFFVQALAENQYLRVLAEPSLVAISGQTASFLAGGEFPIPVVQGGSAGSNVSVTIVYKEFGVRLHFEPTVLGDSRIRLHVAPEVSELSNGPGSVEIQGFSVPALLTRRAETTLELNSGQTFAMAGLISQNTQARSTRVPGLGDLPIIGGLFRSVRYQQGDTELVLLVTASLVEPGGVKSNPPLPGSLHVAPNDWELYALGRVEGRSAGKLSPADSQWLRSQGLNRLRGAGAWANYDLVPSEAPSASQNTP